MVTLDQSERAETSGKYFPLFGYFGYFISKSEPNALYKSQDVDEEETFSGEMTRGGCVLLRCEMPRVQLLINSIALAYLDLIT